MIGWDGEAARGTSFPKPLTQVLIRYEPGWASRSFSDLDAAAVRCDEDAATIAYPVLATGFAGDESRLLAVRRTEPQDVYDTYLVVVRVGDVVSTVEVRAGAGEAVARDLGTRAAARLRSAR
jgi:hypothetical protein